MAYRITGLPAAPFAGLFAMSDQALARHHALRSVADQAHAYPCRISLTDAEPGQAVILLNYEHQPAATPYRSRHAIFVRADERQYDAVDQVPDMLRRRLLSVRGFDANGMLKDADVTEGTQLETAIARLFADEQIDYLHLHFAKYGCYAALVRRS